MEFLLQYVEYFKEGKIENLTGKTLIFFLSGGRGGFVENPHKIFFL